MPASTSAISHSALDDPDSALGLMSSVASSGRQPPPGRSYSVHTPLDEWRPRVTSDTPTEAESLGEHLPARFHRRRGSSGRDATVDDEVVAIDETGFVRREEDRCGGDVFGVDHAWHRLNGRKQGCERGLDVLDASFRVLRAGAGRLREDRRPRG